MKINLTETILDKTRIFESNEILMNGTKIEDLLAACVVSTDCPVKCLSMDTRYTAPAAEKGVEIFAITYVKPPKPAPKEAPKEEGTA